MNASRSNYSNPRGYALVVVLFFLGVGSLMLAGLMNWINTRSRLVQRNQAYQAATGAAEAAVEKALASMTQDFLATDEATVYARLANYRLLVPQAAEDSSWANVKFFDTAGQPQQLSITRLGNWGFGGLQTRYRGLNGYFATYRLEAGASLEALPGVEVSSTVACEAQLVALPVFSLQGYSAVDLEICPPDSLNFRGRVHCNGNLYLDPDRSTVRFYGNVSAGNTIFRRQHPDDPVSRSGGTITFSSERDAQAKQLKLPLGAPHSPDRLRALIEIPPNGEKMDSLLGRQRFYNQADLIIMVDKGAVKATSGGYDNFKSKVPPAIINNFLRSDLSFYDRREGRKAQTVQVDLAQFNQQLVALRGTLGRDPRIIYIANQMDTDPAAFNAVRLVNGMTLPTNGLTVATPNPLYVVGHYNAYSTHLGTTNTTRSVPAAMVADAVTILSANWNDSLSTSDLAARRAVKTTINAGIITGMVPTRDGYYSGGYENLLRLLEDWNNETLTFNGSLAVFYESRVADSPWGALDEVYNSPKHGFSWDISFANPARIPAGTPLLRTVLRANYAVTAIAKPLATKK